MKPLIKVAYLIRDGDTHSNPVWWWKYMHDREMTPSNFTYVMNVFFDARKNHDRSIFSSMRIRRDDLQRISV